MESLDPVRQRLDPLLVQVLPPDPINKILDITAVQTCRPVPALERRLWRGAVDMGLP
jgi:hypothetical protein